MTTYSAPGMQKRPVFLKDLRLVGAALKCCSNDFSGDRSEASIDDLMLGIALDTALHRKPTLK